MTQRHFLHICMTCIYDHIMYATKATNYALWRTLSMQMRWVTVDFTLGNVIICVLVHHSLNNLCRRTDVTTHVIALGTGRTTWWFGVRKETKVMRNNRFFLQVITSIASSTNNSLDCLQRLPDCLLFIVFTCIYFCEMCQFLATHSRLSQHLSAVQRAIQNISSFIYVLMMMWHSSIAGWLLRETNCHYHVVDWDHCVTPEWPQWIAHLHRAAAGRLSERIWYSLLLLAATWRTQLNQV